MPISKRSAALALIMSLLPLVATAQTAQQQMIADQAEESQNDDSTLADRPISMFVPLVDDCIAAPDATTCGDVRAVVTECAADLTEDACDVLFTESEDLFADPVELEQAETALTDTAAAIANMSFAATEGEIGALIDDATRASSERTMLRGDENLNSHSSPPLIADE
ncbi:hypothetical protein SAMN04488003_104175 [Loktanella fryxellensis]|uniref:Secreted protein n=1 Tax=Loktanella fryxellensis TaxID=245187 RepID=A0A1H8B860_9RHOB|nr:hypothetical protein [Loktanella fryxellensis]SEM78228.1 hypothetical protein SAMN04488003_104175 [Loktanella fryxellensis]